jgi:transcriptional regulator with XRE-family HTH domain
MKWNERLRRERLNQGWTQGGVAREIGANTYTVNRWENGHAFPSHFFRQQLSQLFGKSLEELGFVQLVPESERSSSEQAHIPSSFQQLQEDEQPTLTDNGKQAHILSSFQQLQEDEQPTLTDNGKQAHIPSSFQQLQEDEQLTLTDNGKQAHILSSFQQLQEDEQLTLIDNSKQAHILSAYQQLQEDEQLTLIDNGKQDHILSAYQQLQEDEQPTLTDNGKQAHILSSFQQLQEDEPLTLTDNGKQAHIPLAYQQLQEDEQLTLIDNGKQAHIPSSFPPDHSHLYNRQISSLPMSTNEDLPLIGQTWHGSRTRLPLVLLLSVIIAFMTYSLRPSDMSLRSPQQEAQVVIPPLRLQFSNTPQAAVRAMSPMSYEAEAPQNTLTGSAAVVACSSCSGGERVEQIGRGGTLQFKDVSADHAGNYKLTIYYTSGGSNDRTLYMSVNSRSAIALQVPATDTWHTVGMLSITVSLDAGENVITFSNPSARGADIDKIVVEDLESNE